MSITVTSDAYRKLKPKVLDDVHGADGAMIATSDGDVFHFVTGEGFTEREREEIQRALFRSGAHFVAQKMANPIEAIAGGGLDFDWREPNLDLTDSQGDVIEAIETATAFVVIVEPDADEKLQWDGEGGADYRGAVLGKQEDRERGKTALRTLEDYCSP